MQKLIAHGAEAKLFEEGNLIIKERIKKQYRINEIDDKIRKFRTRREAKILEKLQKINFHSPRLIKSDDKEEIIIERVSGNLLRDILKKNGIKKSSIVDFFSEIGRNIAILHNNGIMHGDLTTSNMILNKEYKKIYFIDFGLSFFSDKAEDKAVDMHVLKEGLIAKHNRIWKECFDMIIESYKNKAKNSNETLKRLEVVERRGRYRAKKGVRI